MACPGVLPNAEELEAKGIPKQAVMMPSALPPSGRTGWGAQAIDPTHSHSEVLGAGGWAAPGSHWLIYRARLEGPRCHCVEGVWKVGKIADMGPGAA